MATTLQDTRIEIREALNQARSGIFVDLDGDENFVPPDSTALIAESRIPLLVSHVTARNFEAALPLLNLIDTSIATAAEYPEDPFISWSRRNASGALLCELARYDEAEHELALALIIADRARNEDWQAASLLNVSKIQIRTGRPVAGAQTLARVVQFTNHPVHQAHAHDQMADLLEIQGDTTRGLLHRRLALRSLPNGLPLLRLWLLAPFIVSLISEDHLDEADATILETLDALKLTNNESLSSVFSYIEALALTRRGDPTAALAIIDARPDPFPLGVRLIQNLCVPLVGSEALFQSGRARCAIEHLENWDLTSLTVFEQSRAYALLVEASQEHSDWPRVTFYQEQQLKALRSRRGDPRTVLRLHRQHASAMKVTAQFEELSTVNRQLQATRAERDDLLDIASQDVMSPLTTLRLVLHQLQQAPDDLQRQHRKAETIQVTLDRMEALIPQLSVLGDVRDPLGSQRSNHTDIGELVNELVISHQWASTHKSVKIDLVIEPGTCLIVSGNRPAITHILDSVLANAVRSSVAVSEIKLVVGTRQPDEQVVDVRGDAMNDPPPPATTYIAVTDSGAGLVDHDSSILFTKYVAPVPESDSNAAGGGMNLYVAQKLARSIGAELSATDDTDGGGTCVNLELSIPAENRPE